MKVIYGRRQTGRTTQLIEMVHEAEKRGELSYIVCAGHEQANRIAKRAEEMGKPVPFPITYSEYLNGVHGYKELHLYVDNLDHLIRELSIPNLVEAVVLERND